MVKGGRERRERNGVTLCCSPMSFPKLRLPRECSYVQNPRTTSPTQVIMVMVCVYVRGLMFNVYLRTEMYSKLFDISVPISSRLPTELQGLNEFH